MNRAYWIILTPVVLVAIGYVVVFRAMRVSSAYWILVFPAAILGGAVWWLAKKREVKTY